MQLDHPLRLDHRLDHRLDRRLGHRLGDAVHDVRITGFGSYAAAALYTVGELAAEVAAEAAAEVVT